MIRKNVGEQLAFIWK